MAPETRQFPVIIITGTPGTGKSTHAHILAEESPVPLKHINVGEWVKEKGFYQGFDQEWQSYTVDEDQVSYSIFLFKIKISNTEGDQLLDELEPLASAGGIILDWHTCDIFPERWADLVVVLRCDHTQLWERLEHRWVQPVGRLRFILFIQCLAVIP
jgi:adenylate kinase